MQRTLRTLVVLALMTPALTVQAQPVPANQMPREVVARVKAAVPDLVIKGAELKEREGRRYYDVEGELPGGEEMELDLLETPQGWTVVEIQRDIAWATVPAVARTAAKPAWKGADPVRVIESRQTDGAVIYELFAPGHPKAPALEVMLKDGSAKVLTETWPH